jgi:hypothetical protein
VILVAALLLLVALGLLAAGLVQDSVTLQWGSFAASALSALALGIGSLRRRGAPAGDASAGEAAGGARADRSHREQPVGTPPSVGTTRGAGAGTGPLTIPPQDPGSPSGAGQAPAGPLSEPPNGSHARTVSWPPSGPPSGPPDAPGSGPPPGSPGPPPSGPLQRPLYGLSGPPTTPPGPSYGQPSGPLHGLSGPPTAPPSGPPSEVVAEPATGAHAAARVPVPDGEPPVEEVEVTDLLLVLDLTDEVLVVDEHPRYHLPGCPHLSTAEAIGLPMVEARIDGFTPCGTCAPDHHLAERERARRS